MMARILFTLLIGRICSSGTIAVGGDAPAPPASTPTGVAAILAEHDRALIKSLTAYVTANPGADDIEQAYEAIFQRAIDHDWFAENESLAGKYIDSHPDGAVRPLAQIVRTMARASAGQFASALTSYRDLMKALTEPSQEEFALQFASALAQSAIKDGEHQVARDVYQALSSQYGTSTAVREKVTAELARLDRVGKPAVAFDVKDINGKPVRLADLKGKFVLVDFWATWCTPCLAEMPALRETYDRFHAKGFEIVAVSLDETVPPLADFAKSNDLPWPVIHNATASTDLVAAFGVGSVPASFLIGPNGTVIRLDQGGDACAKVLAAAFEKTPTAKK